MELVVRTLFPITLCVLLAVFVLADSENLLENLENQSAERIQQDNATTTSTSTTTTIIRSNTTFTNISSSNSNNTIISSTRSSNSKIQQSNSNIFSTTKATNFANLKSTPTSTERSIEPGSDIARIAIVPAVTSTTSTTVKPSPKRQISLAEFQKLVAKVNDEIQLLRKQSNNLSSTYDDLVQRYNERISQTSIQVDDSTPGTTPEQIITTTVVPAAVPLADNQYPKLMAEDDHQQPNHLTNIYGNNYYNYIHYYMYPPTEDQKNLVATQQGQNREGSIDHQLTPAGSHPEPDNEQDQWYDSAESSDSWQPAPFHPQNPTSLSEPDAPPSAATLSPVRSSPQLLEQFLARHKITLDPVVTSPPILITTTSRATLSPVRSSPQLLEQFLARHKITLDPVATKPPIPITTTPIPLEKVLTVEHPPHLALAIPTTAKPMPGNSHNGWDGFDFQFVRKAIESKKRAEADGVTEVFE